MEITKLSFSGTPEEFQQVAHLFAGGEAGGRDEVRASAPATGVTSFERNVEGRTKDDFNRLLTRMPVPRGQQQVYKALYDAGKKGLTATKLGKVIGRSKSEMPGVMGALGRRVNATPGIGVKKKPGICLPFYVTKLDNGAGEWHYVMREEMRQALEELNPNWLVH